MPRTLAYPDIVAEIGAFMGISRPAGQCFAMIWRAAAPPCADDLTATLGLSRSNVSTALKELRDWGLIGRARSPGDRKDYFTAPTDPWDVVRLLLHGRQRRAIAPMLDRLLAAEEDTGDVRIAALHAVLSSVGERMEALAGLDPEALEHFLETAAGESAGEDGVTSPGKKKKKKKKA
ncbi:MAG: MarR family transcriptional regulator [Rhodobacteraceae bacterium]|nr:MarR family transcriptional regulator [Paracoccaceae bacterium]